MTQRFMPTPMTVAEEERADFWVLKAVKEWDMLLLSRIATNAGISRGDAWNSLLRLAAKGHLSSAFLATIKHDVSDMAARAARFRNRRNADPEARAAALEAARARRPKSPRAAAEGSGTTGRFAARDVGENDRPDPRS